MPPAIYIWVEQMVLYVFLQKYLVHQKKLEPHPLVFSITPFIFSFLSLYSFYLNKEYGNGRCLG